MKNYLHFLTNEKRNFDKYIVKTESIKKKTLSKYEYTAVIGRLIGIKGDKAYIVFDIDTGKDDIWGILGNILLETKTYFNNFKNYDWQEMKKPVITYWIGKQKAEIKEQKKKKAKTIYTPMGDWTLSRIADYSTAVLIAKYETIKDKSIIKKINKKSDNFEAHYDNLVLTPVKAYIDIEHISQSKLSNEQKAVEIINYIVTSELNNLGERILDPDFRDDRPLLSESEEMELGALWKVYEDLEKELDENQKLSKIEKSIKRHEFYLSIQGKRMDELNSRSMNGGGLTYEEKEEKRKERVREISSQLENVLLSWGIDDENTQKGIAHYQYLYEKESNKRWRADQHFDQIIAASKSELEEAKKALDGKWDSDKLTLLFGVIVSIGISVGFGMASLVTENRFLIGVSSAVLAVTISLFSIKNKFIRRKLLLIMKDILK